MTVVAGVDVGSGRLRKPTGLCRTRDVRFLVTRVTSDGDDRPRERILPRRCEVVALGGPVVCPGFPEDSVRGVEHIFSMGAFQKRCRPLSTVSGKLGRDFRKTSTECLEQVLKNVSTSRELLRFPHVVPNASIVESSPTLFLSVMIDDEVEGSRRGTGRGPKFSSLVDSCLRSGRIGALRERLDWPDDALWAELETGGDAEQQAAVVCSLAAVCVVRKRYVAVGDMRAGFFFLPPWDLWAGWAKDGIAENRRRPEITSRLEIWINAYPRDLQEKLPA